MRSVSIGFSVWLLLPACSPAAESPPEVEGDEPGECDDGADNDLDGLFDCDDPQCSGSPVCADDDDATDDDDDDDDDTAANDDDPVPTDAACTIEVWRADLTGDLIGDEPSYTLYSDEFGRLNRQRYFNAVQDRYWVLTQIRHGDVGGAAEGLWADKDTHAWDFVWDGDSMTEWVDRGGVTLARFEYEDGRLARDIGTWGDCCDGSWREFVYTDGRVSEVLRWDGWGSPDWVTRLQLWYDEDGCLANTEYVERDMPAEIFNYQYEYDAQGRLSAVHDGWNPDEQQLWQFEGACDDLLGGLPRFPGMPYWSTQWWWPVDLCQ